MVNRFKTIFFLLILSCCGKVSAQLSGIYTIPGSYPNIAQAIVNLNTYGVIGPVTINIAAGYTETASVGGYSLFQVVGSSSVNTITFQKNGVGNNPRIYSYNGVNTATSAVQDGIWRFIGADHINIDGIDLCDTINNTATSCMEFGFGFFKATVTNGCQNNTIRNCNIVMSILNNSPGTFPGGDGSRAIEIVNAICAQHTTSLVGTSASGSNSGNKFYSNRIRKCNIGINLSGYYSNVQTPFVDTGNEVGGLLTATGNTVINFGGGGTLSPAAAIQSAGQYSFSVRNNIVDNNTGTNANHRLPLRGIFLNNANAANVSIIANTLSLHGGTTNAQVSVIENNSGSAAAGNTIDISGNMIVSCTQPSNTTGTFYGILNSGSSEHLLVSGNTFSNNTIYASTPTLNLICNNGAVRSNINITGNVLSYSVLNTWTGLLLSINNSASTPSTNVNISNNTFSTYSFVGLTSANSMFIYVTGTNSALSLCNNSWNGITMNTQGNIVLMNNASASQSVLTVCNNSIVSGFSVNIPAPGFHCYYGGQTLNNSPSAVMTCSGNVFSNLTCTVIGNGSFGGITMHEICPAPFARKLIYNNIISNINFSGGPGSFVGISARYLGEGNAAAPSGIYNNTVTNCTSLGYIYGVSLNQNNSPTYKPSCYGNHINNLTSIGPAEDVYGVYVQNLSDGINIYGNKIHSISQTATLQGQAAGIKIISGNGINIYNNIIGDIFAANSSSADAVSGIMMIGGTNYKVYYNTVYLWGSTFGSSCVYTHTSSITELKNNIFVNLCVPTGTGTSFAHKRNTNDLTNYEFISNNNLFYAGPPGVYRVILGMGGVNYQTLAAMKAVLLGRELNSVTENPVFASLTPTANNYLALNPGVPTQIESGAVPINGIGIDYFGTSRNPNFPDIGAIEGPYTPYGTDNIAPNIVSSGFNSPSCNTSNRTFTANISDISGVATGSLSPRAYYKVNNGPYSSVGGTLVSGTPTTGIWSFALTYTANINDVISSFLAIQDNASPFNLSAFPGGGFVGTSVNNITTFPTNPITYTIYGVLSGTYNVGTAGTFTSLSNAAAAYNTSCLNGPVTFLLTDPLYSSNETFPIVFQNNNDASSINTLLLRPASGVAAVIQPTFNLYVTSNIKFLDAKFISVDGINTGGASLTVNNTNTSSTISSDIWLASGGVGNYSITLRNLVLNGANKASCYGILASINGTLLTTNGGYNNDYVTIQTNSFSNCYYGIAAFGASVSVAGGASNWNISYNQVGPADSSVVNLYAGGILLQNTQISSVYSNTISNVNSTNNYIHGININSGVSATSVNDNYIRSIKYSGNSGFGGLGIDINTGSYSSSLTISNNMICNLGGDAKSTFTTGGFAGIRVGANQFSGGINIHHNTVAMNQGSLLAGFNTSCVTSAIYFSQNTYNIDLRDNILYSNIQFTNAASRTYAIYCASSASIFSNNNYNNYFASGPQSNMGFLGVPLPNLGAIQTGFGQNSNSKTLVVPFMSSVNVHVDQNDMQSYFFNNLGLSIPSVTNDIDFQARGANPDMGADEYGPAIICTNASGGNIGSSFSVCTSGSLSISAFNVSGGNGSQYQWQISPTPGGTYTNVPNGLNANTPVYTLGGYAPGTYYFVHRATCPSLSLTSISNEATVTIVAPPSLSVVTSGSMICSGSSATLNASGANSYSWNTGATTSSIVVTPTASGIYNVQGINAPCPAQQSPDILIYYSISPTITANSGSICSGQSFTIIASGALTYSITGNNFTVSPAISTSYTVTGTSTAGCTSTNVAVANVTVSASPTISVNSGSICSGQQFIIAPSGAGAYTVSGNNFTVSPPVNSTYQVIGTSTAGCASTNTAIASITVNAVPVVSVNTGSICAGQSFTIVPVGANTYTFSGGSAVVSPSITTSYSVTGTSTAGCVSLPVVTTVSVFVVPLVPIASNTAICAGNTVNLAGSGATSYTWSNGVINNTPFTPTATTIYTLSGTANGCTTSTVITIVMNAIPSLTFNLSSSTICIGESATLTATGASNYTWQPGGNLGSQNIVSPSVTIIYTVTGESNGCIGTSTLTLLVDPCTFLNEFLNEKEIEFYPNPSSGNIQIGNLKSGDYTLEIYNAAGQLSYECKLNVGMNNIDTRLCKGIHFIRINQNGKPIKQSKLVVE